MASTNYSNGVPSHCFSSKNCPTLPLHPAYKRHLFNMEKEFDFCSSIDWMERNWKICYVFIGVYLLAIYFGQRYMKHRPPFKLRGALLAWNAGHAVFSIFSAWRMVSAIAYYWGLIGFYESLCGEGFKQHQQAIGMYMWYFSISKFLELGDTAFIVLRKTPLIFLHWFHHASVCFFVWSTNAYPTPISIYLLSMNLFVHAFMYSYYCLKVLKIHVPKLVSMALTALQLIQMVGGGFIAVYSYRMKMMPGVGCCMYDEFITISLTIYLCYFLLFLNFFVRSYIFKKPRQGVIKKTE